MKVLKVNPDNLEKEVIKEIVEVIKKGGPQSAYVKRSCRTGSKSYPDIITHSFIPFAQR